MSISITATGNDGGSVNLTVQSGIGPVGPNAALIGGTGIDVTYANGEATLDVNATLATLTDVSSEAPSAGQVLEWNGTAWAPGTDTTLNLSSAVASNLGTAAVGIGTAAAREDHVHAMPALGDLTDVTLVSPSAGHVLTWTGSAWSAAADSTNLTGYATESYVDSAVANLVDSSPATLDTLNELAAALGDDANFAANVTASLAGKASLNHTHEIANVTGLQAALDAKAATASLATVATSGNYSDLSGIPSEFTPAAHNHTSADVTDFAAAAAANAPLQSLNNLTGDIVIANGTGLTLTESGTTLTLEAALPPSNLADLADVSGTPVANQALLYNGTAWQPGNIPAGTTLNSLSGDLTLANGTGITLATSGQTLTLSAALPPSNLADLADVSAASPSADQILVYNGTAWEAKNNSGGTTINTLAGAVALVAGSNVAITESGQNITISATADGLTGDPANLTIGTVSTLAAGSNATATLTGTAPDYTLAFGIPAGATGAQGDPGPTTNLTIGSVTTGAEGSSAAATISGTAPDLTLDLTIPVGATGATGATGSTGATGDPGPTTNLTIGTVTTGAAGSNATATIVGTPPDLTLNLTIPQGDTGAAGSSGVSLGLLFALT